MALEAQLMVTPICDECGAVGKVWVSDDVESSFGEAVPDDWLLREGDWVEVPRANGLGREWHNYPMLLCSECKGSGEEQSPDKDRREPGKHWKQIPAVEEAARRLHGDTAE